MWKNSDSKFNNFTILICMVIALGFLAAPISVLADGANAELTSGVPVAGSLSGTGAKDYYYITIPSGCTALDVITQNGPGGSDFDLYVKRGSQPTTSSYDVKGYTSSSNEACPLTDPASGTYYIMVISYSGSGSYEVKATKTGGDSLGDLSLAVPSSGVLTGTGDMEHFTLDLGVGYSSLTIQTYNGPTGADFDLYVKYGTPPTTSSYDVKGYTSSSDETCQISNPSSGTYYIMAHSYSGSGSYDIVANAEIVGDTTPPSISAVSGSSLTSDSITITWTTNEASSSLVEYGTTTGYGSTATGSNGVTFHTVSLSGLSGSTTYHFRVKSTDASSNVGTSSDYTFTTQSAGDTTPPVISEIGASSITDTGATIIWTTDESSTSTVNYGTTTSYGSTATGSGGVTSHSVSFSGLSASTTYHCRVVSTDIAGNTATSTDRTFTTASSGTTTTILTLGVTSDTYSFSSAGQSKYFQVTVGSGYSSLVVFMDGPSSGADYDLYVKRGSQPTTSSYDARGYTNSADETCTVSNPAAATYYIMTYCYSGSGNYNVRATITGGADVTPPVISSVSVSSISSNSATITWSTNEPASSIVEYGTTTGYGSSLTGANGVTSHSVALSNLLASKTYHFRVKSADASGNTATSSDNVFTTSSDGSGTTVLTLDGSAGTGSLTASGDKEYFTVSVPSGKTSLKVDMSGPSTADFDLYVRFGTAPTTSTYDSRGYTGSSTESCTITNPPAGTYHIMAISYSGSGSYSVQASSTEAGSSNKWALVIGISNYQYISDLSYCDEDAVDWTNYLQGKGYTVHTLIDSQASEAAIYNEIDNWLLPNERAGDDVAICFSGHGGFQSEGGYSNTPGQVDGHPSQFFAWNADGSGHGCILDTVLATHLSGLDSTHVFIFFDCCRSGGMDEVAAGASSGRYVAETCGWNEYGYDAPSYNNGAWTYWYLDWALKSQGYTSCESAFSAAAPKYHAEHYDSNPEQEDHYPGTFTL